MSTTTKSESISWHGFKPAELPDVAPWVETFGRAGHVAKGVVYFIIGLLSFRLAIGAGGEVSGAKGAIREIGQQPFGRILLGVVAIGLLCYTAWRWIQSAKDTEGKGTDAKGLAVRVGYAISGFIYLSLGLYAGKLAAFGRASDSQGTWSQTLLSESWGQALLAVIGLIVVGIGIHSIRKGYHASFMSKYDFMSMSETMRKFALHAGRTGLITRGIAVAIIGGFLLNSAWKGTAGGELSGMSDALAAIAAQSYGGILIGTAGFGLMCYAFHMILLGWYRRFNVSTG